MPLEVIKRQHSGNVLLFHLVKQGYFSITSDACVIKHYVVLSGEDNIRRTNKNIYITGLR